MVEFKNCSKSFLKTDGAPKTNSVCHRLKLSVAKIKKIFYESTAGTILFLRLYSGMKGVKKPRPSFSTSIQNSADIIIQGQRKPHKRF